MGDDCSGDRRGGHSGDRSRVGAKVRGSPEECERVRGVAGGRTIQC